MRLEYRHATLGPGEVESFTNRLGAEGFRLHTCDPVVVQSTFPGAQAEVWSFVVMERMVQDDPPPRDQLPGEAAMRVKG